jgi:hypothetical protein
MVSKGSKKSGWRMRTRRSKTRRGGEGEEEAEMMSKAADMNKAAENMTMPDVEMTEDEEVMDPVIQDGEMPESSDEDQQDEEDMGPDEEDMGPDEDKMLKSPKDDEDMAPVIDEMTESPEEVEEPQVQLSEDDADISDEEEGVGAETGGKKRRRSLKKSQQKRRQTKRSKKGRKGKKTKRAKRSKTRRRGSRK